MKTHAVAAVPIALALLLSACGGLSGDRGADQKAQQLVSEVHAAGLAPNLTVGTAEALYGNSAPTVCKRLSSSVRWPLEASLAGSHVTRKPKERTRDAVRYAGIVVSVYCPGKQDEFNALVQDWDLT